MIGLAPSAASVLAILVLAGGGPRQANAQSTYLSGIVRDAETGLPIPLAEVRIPGLDPPGPALTDERGRYSLGVPAGIHMVHLTTFGYADRRVEVAVAPDGVSNARDFTLRRVTVALPGVVISSSRGAPERTIEASQTTHLIDERDVDRRITQTVADHLNTVPGIDMIVTGVTGRFPVARGFGNIFSGSLHVLNDHRLAKVPSLGANLMHLIPATDDDIERIEVILGPGSALYGPNTANGIVHLLTKSPLSSRSTVMTVGGGERHTLQGSFRSSIPMSEHFGLKLSGQFLRSEEWPYEDPTERAARARAASDPEFCVEDRLVRGLDPRSAERACGRIGARESRVGRWSLEARGDWRFDDDGTAVATVGHSVATGIELTALGAAQSMNWAYDFYQVRVEQGGLFGQVYMNTNDAGDSYLLRSGAPLTDRSTLVAAQLRQSLDPWKRLRDLTFGIDFFGTRPNSDETIYGSYEDADDLDEWGVYLRSKTALMSTLELTLAGRVDFSSLVDHVVFSPRAALVYSPGPRHGFRMAYNRAFSTPSTLISFLDISGGYAPEPFGSMGYGTRAFGAGRDGYGFAFSDTMSIGVRSPFNPAGAGELIPAEPETLWGFAVSALGAIESIDEEMAALLRGLEVGAVDIGLTLLDPATGSRAPASEVLLRPVAPLRETSTETVEVGWTGVLWDRVQVTAGAYHERRMDFVAPLTIQTPLVQLDERDVRNLIDAPIGAAIVDRMVSNGAQPEEASRLAEMEVKEWARRIAELPLAVVSSGAFDAAAAEFVSGFENVGDVQFWGVDLALRADLGDLWTLTGTYSHMSEDFFEIVGARSIAMNAPKHKGTLGMSLRTKTIDAGVSARFTSSFPAASAGYTGIRCANGESEGRLDEACVRSAAVYDIQMGYRIRDTGATVQVSVTNAFNAPYRSFVGVPEIGRLTMVRLRYEVP